MEMEDIATEKERNIEDEGASESMLAVKTEGTRNPNNLGYKKTHLIVEHFYMTNISTKFNKTIKCMNINTTLNLLCFSVYSTLFFLKQTHDVLSVMLKCMCPYFCFTLEEAQPDVYCKLKNPAEDVYAEAYFGESPLKKGEGTLLYYTLCGCLFTKHLKQPKISACRPVCGKITTHF